MKRAAVSRHIEENILSASRIMVTVLAEALMKESTEQITVPQFRILDMIHNYSNRPAEIARMLGVSPPAISFLLERLEGKGLIRRNFNRVDRRRVELRLTRKGAELVQRVNARRKRYLKRVLRDLDETTLVQLEGSLEAFNRSYLRLKRGGWKEDA